MAHSLNDARIFAKIYRYTGDKELPPIFSISQSARRAKKEISSNGLQISNALTPKLYESLRTACDNLKFPIENVSAYVSASPELQAQCFEADDENCIINISSGLINLLHADEITFVIGHEIGHHILKHNQEREFAASVEGYMSQRAKEISVDRAGLIACQSLECSLRATMKVISGLPDQYIRFDTSNFINQLRAADQDNASLADSLNTHPSLVLRARALLWFSMNDAVRLDGKSGSLSMDKINLWVMKDLDRYVDKPVREKISKIESDLFFWTSAKMAALKGKLTKTDRSALTERFGEENIRKLIATIEGLSVDEVAEFLNQKIAESTEELTCLVPASVDERIKHIDKKAFID